MGIKLTRIILMVFTAVILVITSAAGPAAGGEPPYQAGPAEGLNGLQTGEPYILFRGLENSPFGVFPYRMNPDGSNKQLFESDHLDYSRLAGAMEVSLDGRTLAYTSTDEEKGNTIYLLDLADGTSSELPLDTYENGSPRWSPDGQTIAYLAEGLNGRFNAVDLTTGQTRELLNASIFIQMFGETGRVNSFDWSPDGSQLVAGMIFDPNPESSPYSGVGMILVNADGSNPRPVMAPELPGWSPTWSHDADLIYYVCELPLAEICVFDLTTFQIMQVSHFSDVFGNNDYHIANLDISPDNQIVFEFYDRTLPLHETPDIYRFDVATGEWANLTLDLDIELYGPRWVYPPAVPPIASAGPAAGGEPPYQAGPAEALNGLQTGEPYILFVGVDRSPFGVFPYRMNPDGSNKQLFESDHLDYSRLRLAMEVSPDGRTLAYTSSDEESGYTIYLLDLATGTSSKLPLDTYDNGLPRWSPDGQTIAYRAEGTNGMLNAVDLSTGQTRELLNARIFYYQVFGHTGRVESFDWSPDGSQLIASMNFDPSIEGPSGNTLVLVNADGSNPRPLTTPYIDGWGPTWGHDGGRIYYSCLVSDGENSANEICAIDLATLEITQLSYFNQTLAGNYGIRNLDISPDNRIVFELSMLSLPIHERPDIYRFDVATGEWANLTLDLDIELYDPRWVYPPAVPPVANAGPDQTVIDADSSGSEVVTLDGSAAQAPSMSVSLPVHGRMLMGGNLAGTVDVNPTVSNQILLLNTFDGSVELVLEGERGIADPVWNQDGSTFVYANFETSPMGLNIYNLQTQSIHNVIVSETLQVLQPLDWFPDGDRLLFYDHMRVNQTWQDQLQFITLSSGAITPLFTYVERVPSDTVPLPPGMTEFVVQSIRRAAWNPVHAEWIVVHLSGYDRSTVYGLEHAAFVYNLQTGEKLSLNALFTARVGMFAIRWSADGEYLMLSTSAGSGTLRTEIVRLANADGVWSLQTVDGAHTPDNVAFDWLGVDNLLFTSTSDPNNDDHLIHIAQIIDGTLHTTEFLRLSHSVFERPHDPKDWYLDADEEERHALSCLFDQALETRLMVGTRARVNFTDGTPLRLRAEPDFDAPVLTQMAEGTPFDVIGGSACVNSDDYYRFWRLELDDGTVGWAAEADPTGYFIEPLPTAAAAGPDQTVTDADSSGSEPGG